MMPRHRSGVSLTAIHSFLFYFYFISFHCCAGGEYFKLVARQLKKKDSVLHVDGDNEKEDIASASATAAVVRAEVEEDCEEDEEEEDA